MKNSITALVAGGVVVVLAAGLTITSHSQRAADTASRPEISEIATSVAISTADISSPLSDYERIRDELLSLGLAIERVDFQDTMPASFRESPLKPSVAIKLNPSVSAIDSETAEIMLDYILHYEIQTGASITSYLVWMQEGRGGTWSSVDSVIEPINTSNPSFLDDARATEAVREVLNLTSDDARKYVSVSVSTLKLSKTQRQFARIEIQASPEARAWLTTFGGDTQSPQRVIVDRLGDIDKLNSAEDIEIIFAGLSVPNAQASKDLGYFKKFYLPPALYGDVLNTNDPMYFPSAPPSGPPTVMPMVLPHMISPLPTPATP